MTTDRRTHVDRFDTKMAKRAERVKTSEEVWAEVNEQEKLRDDKTARLKAARLARDTEVSTELGERWRQEKSRRP